MAGEPVDDAGSFGDRACSGSSPKTVSGDRHSGWTLEFCTVFGAMHNKTELIRHRFAFTTDFRIQYDSTSLSSRIFKGVPMVKY